MEKSNRFNKSLLPLIAAILLVLIIVALALIFPSQPADYRPVSTPTPPVPVVVTDAPFDPFESAKSSFSLAVEATPPAKFDLSAVSPDGKSRAGTACAEAGGKCAVFLTQNGVVYRLNAAPFIAERSFDRLSWVSNEVLAFEQLARTEYRMHYEVDVTRQKLIVIESLPVR